MMIQEIKEKYKIFKQKEGDNLLIKIGVVGVVIGLLFSLSFLNQLFAWFLLLGCAIKLFDFVLDAQKKFNNPSEENKPLSAEIEETYKRFKQNEGDTLFIKIGVIGVLIGLVFSISFINQFFAWFILLGCAIKLYDFVIDAKNKVSVKNKE